MKESILREKSCQFALIVVKLYQFVVSEKNEYVLSISYLKNRKGICPRSDVASPHEVKALFVGACALTSCGLLHLKYFSDSF